MPPDMATGTSHADDPDALLRGTAPFIVLTGPAAAGLAAAIARLDPHQVAILHIRNPGAAPLSLERLMLQVVPGNQPNDGPAAPDDARRLLRALTARAAGRPALLVAVEQADTLTAAALALLQILPGLQNPGLQSPHLQNPHLQDPRALSVRVAFAGAPAFRTMLDDPRFRPIRDAASPPPPPAPPGQPATERAGAAAAAPPAPPAHQATGKRRLIPVLAAATSIALALLCAAALLPRSTPSPGPPPLPPAPIPSTPPIPAPPAAAPTVPSPDPAADPAIHPPESTPVADPPYPAPVTPAEDPALARARLFREFNEFVQSRGLARRLSPADREALFQEYLLRRQTEVTRPTPDPANPDPATPDPATPDPVRPGPDVVLVFGTDAPGALALANQDAALLRDQVPNVTLRPVAESPADPVVKYFRPQDRAQALAVARALLPAATDWLVVDLSTAARPARPTIEVWLPGSPTPP